MALFVPCKLKICWVIEMTDVKETGKQVYGSTKDLIIASAGLILAIIIFLIPLAIFGKMIFIPLVLFLFLAKITIVDESTAQIAMRLGAIKDCFIQWEGFHLDDEWNVVEGKSLFGLKTIHFRGMEIKLGGLRIVGIRGLDTIYKYQLRWQDLHLQEGGKEVVVYHEKVINYVPLRRDTYWAKIFNAETMAKEERLNIDVEFLITMKVVNPYRVIFKSPYNWVENVISNLNAVFIGYVGGQTLDQLLTKKGSSDILIEIKDDAFVAVLKKEWGVEIEAIRIRDIGLPPDIQKAAAAKREQEMIAAGRAAETVGTVLQMMAQSSGKKLEEIQQEIRDDPEMRKKFLDMAEDLVERKIAIEGNSFVDVRVKGSQGLEQSLLNLVSVWGMMSKGTGPAGSGQKNGKKDKKKSKKSGIPPGDEKLFKDIFGNEDDEEDEDEKSK